MIPLNQIHVPKPCDAHWEGMGGDAQRRFCDNCGCHVHDLSVLTTAQAQTLLDQTDGRVCVRFETRPDGTVLTQDAVPVLAHPRFWPRCLATASWALALALTGLGLTARAITPPHKTGHVQPKSHAAPAVPKSPHRTMGKIVVPRVTLGEVVAPSSHPPPTNNLPPSTSVTMGKPALSPPPRK